ncbi:MAG: DUF2336 domain-containing protein [Alphaproteobacteria bacterium]|nr:DUF2336 domain-containing protein [Alphaproteobacteria bacterium]
MYSQSLIDIFGAEHLMYGEARLSIVKQMSDLAHSPKVTKAELDIVQMVFSEFYRDHFMAVRLEISKAICEAEYISRHLILRMAEDCASVSQFILHHSNKLSPVDLIDFVIKGDAVKQLAIAHRRNLSNDVALSLIKHGSLDVIYALVENQSAMLNADNLRQLYTNFNMDAGLRSLLSQRHDLPADLRELIVYDVAKTLEDYVINVNWLGEGQASGITQKSYEIAAIEISVDIADANMMDYIKRLSAEERLTSSLILRSVTTGYMKFFEYSLAYLSGLPIKKLHSLLHNPNGSTRNALFNRSKLPQDLHPVLTIAVDVYRDMKFQHAGNLQPGTLEFSVNMIKNVTECYHMQLDSGQAYLQRVLDCYYIDISDRMAA